MQVDANVSKKRTIFILSRECDMEIWLAKILVPTFKFTWCYSPEDQQLYIQCRESVRSYLNETGHLKLALITSDAFEEE